MAQQKLRSIEDLHEGEEQKLFLTPEQVRVFPKYANASDEEVWNAINTFHKLAIVTYEAFAKEEHRQMAATENEAKDQT